VARLIVVAVVLALGCIVVVWIVGARGRARFRDGCLAIPPGTRLGDVPARLEALGGVYVGKVAAAHQWYRAPRWSFKGATCHVTDDAPPNPFKPDPTEPLPDGKVVAVRFTEGIPIL
jgi:hypothetical protein